MLAIGPRNVLGKPKGGRTLLETYRQPFYDRKVVSNGDESVSCYSDRLGATDTDAVNGKHRTLADTNLKADGELGGSNSLSAFGMSLIYEAGLTLTQLEAFFNTGFIKFEIENQLWAEAPLCAVPCANAIVGVIAGDTNDFSGQMGHPSLGNLWDFVAPELFWDPKTDVYEVTGREVPIEIQSDDPITFQIEFPGGISLGSGNTAALRPFLWGIARRKR